jgi:LysM repeat protein
MHRDARQSPARVLAPLALVLCALAFIAVVFTSGSGDGDDGSTARTTTTERERTRTSTRPRRSVYVVKQGDSLGAIAAKTGVDVETLQELNPGLDPQGLVIGQRIKLRE